MAMKLQEKYLAPFVAPWELQGMAPMVAAAARQVEEGTGLGNDFLGWVDLPVDYDKEEFARIKAAAKKIQGDSEVLLVIGIGLNLLNLTQIRLTNMLPALPMVAVLAWLCL